MPVTDKLLQNWSYTAKNETFKAFRQAGFNKSVFKTLEDTILISEPEAAAIFTASDVRADRLAVSLATHAVSTVKC